MTRDAVTIQTLTTNGGTIATAGSVNTTNGQSIAAGALTRNLIIQVKNAGTVDGTVAVSEGAYPPAFRRAGPGTASPGGTIFITVPAASERIITLESARVAQTDGSIYLDFTPSGFVGNTYVYRLGADL